MSDNGFFRLEFKKNNFSYPVTEKKQNSRINVRIKVNLISKAKRTTKIFHTHADKLRTRSSKRKWSKNSPWIRTKSDPKRNHPEQKYFIKWWIKRSEETNIVIFTTFLWFYAPTFFRWYTLEFQDENIPRGRGECSNSKSHSFG